MKLVESDIVANGISHHVYRTNREKPPLLFAHGRSDNGLCYWPIAQAFAERFEIILYDSRNHGKSQVVEAETTLMDRAHDLAGVVEALALQRPSMVGHSLGAITIALFAGLYPDIPRCIVLEDPPPLTLMASGDARALASPEERQKDALRSKQMSVAELVEVSRRENPTWPEAEREPWARAKQQFSPNTFYEQAIDVERGEQILSRIICPVLLLTADLEKGALYPPEAAEAWAAELPNARHVNIAGAGHNIRREQPAAFLRAVSSFLDDATAGERGDQ